MEDLSAQSDNEPSAQSLRGDTVAFGTLVLRYRRMVTGTAYRVCGDAALTGAYYDGELSARRRQQVEAHLEDCVACRARLSEMERLSDVLAAYELPDTLTRAETFRAQVALRLSRRAQRRAGYVGWAWHLVPLGLICALLGILGLFAAADLLRGILALTGWTGVDVLALLGMPDLVTPTMWVYEVLFSLVRGLGGLTVGLCAYLGMLFVFAVYAGWVGALWRARARP